MPNVLRDNPLAAAIASSAQAMTRPERLYAPLRHLSLDVALGAAATSRLLMDSLGRHVPWQHDVLLAMAVWLIYAVDHWADSRRLGDGDAALANRHAFFKAHRAVLLPVMAMVAVMLAAGMLWWRFPLWPGALLAAIPTLGYVVMDRCMPLRTTLAKSCCIAAGFALGLSIFGAADMAFWRQAWPVVAAIFFLALYNVWIFQRQETRYDAQVLHERVGLHPLVRHDLTRKLPWVGFAAMLALATPPWRLTVTLLAMGLLLLLCDWQRAFFAHHERYRVLGDGVFLLPALALMT